MRIVLTHEKKKKVDVFDEPIPEVPPAGAPSAQRDAFK